MQLPQASMAPVANQAGFSLVAGSLKACMVQGQGDTGDTATLEQLSLSLA